MEGKYISMNGLKRDVIYDEDGSLAPLFNMTTPQATLIWGYAHIAKEELDLCNPSDLSQLSGYLLCEEQITIRRIYFTNLKNKSSSASSSFSGDIIVHRIDNATSKIASTNDISVGCKLGSFDARI